MVFMYICTVNGVTCIDRVASKDWLLIQSWPCVTPTINFSQFHLIKLHTSQPTHANHDEQDKTQRREVQSLFPRKSHSWNPETRPKIMFVWSTLSYSNIILLLTGDSRPEKCFSYFRFGSFWRFSEELRTTLAQKRYQGQAANPMSRGPTVQYPIIHRPICLETSSNASHALLVSLLLIFFHLWTKNYIASGKFCTAQTIPYKTNSFWFWSIS